MAAVVAPDGNGFPIGKELVKDKTRGIPIMVNIGCLFAGMIALAAHSPMKQVTVKFSDADGGSGFMAFLIILLMFEAIFFGLYWKFGVGNIAAGKSPLKPFTDKVNWWLFEFHVQIWLCVLMILCACIFLSKVVDAKDAVESDPRSNVKFDISGWVVAVVFAFISGIVTGWMSFNTWKGPIAKTGAGGFGNCCKPCGPSPDGNGGGGAAQGGAAENPNFGKADNGAKAPPPV